MKKKAYLVCYTSSGYPCLRILMSSVTAAVNEGRLMKREGFAFSYLVFDEEKKHVLKRG